MEEPDYCERSRVREALPASHMLFDNHAATLVFRNERMTTLPAVTLQNVA